MRIPKDLHVELRVSDHFFFFFFGFEGSALRGSGPLWRSKSIFDAEAGPPHVRLQCRSKVASKTNVRLQNLYL